MKAGHRDLHIEIVFWYILKSLFLGSMSTSIDSRSDETLLGLS